MTETVATCVANPSDTITASATDDENRVRLLAEHNGVFKLDVFLKPEEAREFARGILALAGGSSRDDRPVSAGDRVRIIRAHGADRFLGRVGVVDHVDVFDDNLPYCINDERGNYMVWASEVEQVTETTTATESPREALIRQAKELLDGTTHTGMDVVRVATFLAGD
ncbi:hypothetical protein [Streptomyces sp. NPDC058280]|uniref:hypothetical protein n=1 Tax=Streptomyces sp. NPDC058280 TaxID=3346419 RepID=UPI0036EAE557